MYLTSEELNFFGRFVWVGTILPLTYTTHMLFWGLTFGIIGKVLLGLTVIMVHNKITHEKRIDGLVLMEMKREQAVAFIGIALMIFGYTLELVHYELLNGFVKSIFSGTLF